MRRVVAALAVVYVVWGSTYLAIAVAIETLPPFLMAALRFGLAGVALALWTARRGDWAGQRPDRRQWAAATVTGGLMLVGGNGAVTWAEQHIDSGVAALLVATVPLWMGFLAHLSGERLRARAVVGLVTGFAGVGLLVGGSAGGGVAAGPALVVVAGAAAWAGGSLLSQRLALPARPLVATAMQMLAGSALFALVGVAGGELSRLDVGAVSGRSLLAVAYLAAFGSVLAFSAYVWLLRNAATSLTATYAYVNPVVAVLLGWAVLGEPITGRTVLAGGVIVVAVALIVGARAPAGSAARRLRRHRHLDVVADPPVDGPVEPEPDAA